MASTSPAFPSSVNFSLLTKPYFWEPQIPFQADSSGDSNRRERIRNTVTKNSRRENLLKSLEFDPDRDVDLSEAIANDFIIPTNQTSKKY